MSSIAVDTVDEPEMDIMDEADMFVDSDGSSLEYIATTDYEDFASSSIGGLAIGQFDGAMTDEEMDDDELDAIADAAVPPAQGDDDAAGREARVAEARARI